ncbi:MAG: GNAT family N-acetyltransferase [Planctomyces sp.]|nr:GNAT family N-acetyltransferase [Planctomyces sp.]
MAKVIRKAGIEDADAVWKILEPVIRRGEAFAFPREMTQAEAIACWLSVDRETFVVEENNQIQGTYYLRQNQFGGGSHVANCGYATAGYARGQGIARLMCMHSLEEAKSRGFRAMQFNFVVSSNLVAVHLWKSLGFQIVGTLPDAFAHPTLGEVDAYVMFRKL